MNESIMLKISSDGKAYLIEQGLTTREREIDPQSITELVMNSLTNKVTDSYGSSPLPKNCIYYGVVERYSAAPEEIVIIEREACIRPYNHFGSVYNVGYPKLIFAYAIQAQQIMRSAVVATNDDFIQENSNCYQFPYANVYSSGIICMGSYTYPKIEKLVDLNFLPEAFYLIEHTHETNASNQMVKELLEEAMDKPFNNDRLVFKCTFGQFVEGFVPQIR